ncbi:TPA: dihydroxy-acid dehydratase, partial [Legionella anisa]
MAYFIHTLLDAELLHQDVDTVMGKGLDHYTYQPLLDNHELVWVPGPQTSSDENVLVAAQTPFKDHGGLNVLSGNIGRCVIKTSGLAAGKGKIKAAAVVCSSQDEFEALFKEGHLERNCIVVVRFQGPKASGMPELHQLTPKLGVLMDKGYKVALVTDGRMSGASGKVPAAIHVTPEAVDNEVLSRIKTGDIILIDAEQGILQLLVSDDELQRRSRAVFNNLGLYEGCGRELFASLRAQFSQA